MNFFNRLRYGTLALDQEEADTLEYREAKKKDYTHEQADHDYGKSSIPDKYNLSLMEKGKSKYWTTKQYVKEKLGKGEMFSVADDAEMEAQIHRARHLQKQMVKLSMAFLKYQRVVQALTRKETSLGMLLKAYGESESAAGMPGSNSVLGLGLEDAVQPVRDLMCKLGDAIQSDAIMLAELDPPIGKLFNEVQTFRLKALRDCLLAVSDLNTKKTRFHGALLWMTDAANSLSDPDAKKELANFREAQHMVKVCKAEFEAACVSVASKTELLLSSLHNLFALHFPGYVTALAAQLQSADAGYGDIYRWTRETMIHQYKRAVDVQREHVVSQLSCGDDSGFDTAANTTEDVHYENWSNEAVTPQAARAEAPASNLDWLLDGDPAESSAAKTCEDIQDLLIELSNEKSGATEQVQASAEPSLEQLDKVLDCDMAAQSDRLCDGEIKQITNDEANLDDIIPMDQKLWQRQQGDLAREEQISADLDKLLAGLSFDVVLEPEELVAPSQVLEPPSPLDDDESSNRELASVSSIWQALENNFTPVAIAEAAEQASTGAAAAASAGATTGNAEDGGVLKTQNSQENTAASQRDGGIRKWFSRATQSSSSDDAEPAKAQAQADPTTTADKFASILGKLAPDADDRALKNLMDGDTDDLDASEALM